jgi:MFS transporter, DHA1 family, multidrug resistance protein
MSLVYGILYLTLTLYPYTFGTNRQLSSMDALLPFLFLLGGIFLASGIIMLHSVQIARSQAAGDALKPEDRLPPAILGSILLPAGTFTS